MKKNVDIILPVYNSENYIIDTIKSIINQTYKDWRLIIIDDNSTDSTERVIINFINSNQYKNKILFFKNKINKGQAFSRNKALKLVKSEFVGFIDSDDTWAKNKLRTQIKFMLKNNYYFTYSNYKSLKNKLIKNISVPNFFDYKNYVRNTSIATSTMIVKKKNIF
jgi:teichuronic acid biosynthesis glycosyltransferase TuaG